MSAREASGEERKNGYIGVGKCSQVKGIIHYMSETQS